MLLALMDSGGVPGLALALVTEGSVTSTTGFGVRSSTDTVAVDANTVFEAASLSKTVTAYAALRLIDKGLLALDRPLADYLPHPELGRDRRARVVTARMIMAHTSGLQNERIGREPFNFQFEPGSAFRYSGEGYQYLGKVMENVAGMPFDAVITREVFAPLGMTRSSFIWSGSYEANSATGHNAYREARKPTIPARARPAASLHTTAHDYALFMSAVMMGRGLSAQIWREMLTPQIPVAEKVSWGLGWGLEVTKYGNAVWHHGDNSNSGFTAFTLWYPDHRSGLVYLANSTAGLGITSRLLAILGAPFSGAHPALEFIDYEKYNAPARIARLALEKEIRSAGVQAGLTFYRHLKISSPPDVVGEKLLNDIGYRLVSLGLLHEAIEIFKANVQEYPSSYNVYDSLAEAYAAAGELDLALSNYERSVAINPEHAHGIATVRELRKKLGRSEL